MPVETDKENGRISKAEFEAKRRRKKELDARLNAARSKIEADIRSEETPSGNAEGTMPDAKEKKRSRPKMVA